MCLVAWSLDQHARFPLVLASNRDEFLDRPTAGLAWWPATADGRQVLAGRDLQAGGTWLGLSNTGRLALLTNIRAPQQQRPDAPSRGAIVPAWLDSDLPADTLWARTASAGHNGFNLVHLDLVRRLCHWMSSDHPGPVRLDAGLYGLSNGALDEPWPKVRRLKAALDGEVRDTLATKGSALQLAERLLLCLQDRQRADDAELPATGVPADIERGLSSIFIDMPERRYGTRSSTVLVVERVQVDGAPRHAATLIERTVAGAADTAELPALRSYTLPDWPSASTSDVRAP